MKGRRIVHAFDQTIRQEIHDANLRNFWSSKDKVATRHQQQINWDGLEHAAANERKTRTIGIVKLFSGQIATNATLQKWKMRPDAICPRCGEETKDEMHVLQCEHPEAINRWKTKIRALQQWMEEEAKTHPGIADTIHSTLCSWKLHKQQTPPVDRNTREAFYEQTTIGWWNFMFGLHSNKWQKIQQAHYDRIGSKRSVRRWTSLLIRKLWDTAWDQWQHRCYVANDTTDTPRCATEALDAQIRREAQQGPPPNCPNHYHNHFSSRLVNAVLRQPTHAKQTWLQFTHDLRNVVTTTQTTGSVQQQRRTMHAFLRPANPQWDSQP